MCRVCGAGAARTGKTDDVGIFDNVRQAVRNARSGTVDLSELTPEQLARHEAEQARIAAAQEEAARAHAEARALTEAALERRVLRGPAGDHLHGPIDTRTPEQIQAELSQGGALRFMRQSFAQAGKDFGRELVKAYSTGAPPEIDDAETRARQAAAERAARDAARAPYLAAQPPPVTISRLATRGATQVGELIAWLGISGLAARPDLVYGVARVPDRISPTLTTHSERGRVVEWDVVHVPAELPPAPPAVTTALFPARLPWVARAVGEPSVLDEDLALAYCAWAGVTPEHCFGLARHVHIRRVGRGGDDESPDLATVIEGIYALHAPTPGADGMVERMAAGAPLDLPSDADWGARVVVLDWTEVPRVVQPQAQKPPRVPSPFPYLPSTPQELLVAYLQVVGIASADCYSAQVTALDARHITGSFGWGGEVNTGPRQPCADGKARARIAGASCIVIVHRDRPEHEAGRARWAAYQRDVLHARFDRPVGREPLYATDGSDIANPLLRGAFGALDTIDSLTDWMDGVEQLPPFRYCWPPVRR